jgi:hypothetical protein
LRNLLKDQDFKPSSIVNRNVSRFALNSANTYPDVDGQFAFFFYFYFWGENTTGDNAMSER